MSDGACDGDDGEGDGDETFFITELFMIIFITTIITLMVITKVVFNVNSDDDNYDGFDINDLINENDKDEDNYYDEYNDNLGTDE